MVYDFRTQAILEEIMLDATWPCVHLVSKAGVSEIFVLGLVFRDETRQASAVLASLVGLGSMPQHSSCMPVCVLRL